MKTRRAGILVAACCALVSTVFVTGGCYAPSAPPQTAESNRQDRPQAPADPTSGDGRSTTPAAESPTSAASVVLPDDFPDDVPICPGAVITQYSTDDDAIYLALRSPAPEYMVAAYYFEQLKTQGWQMYQGTHILGLMSVGGQHEGRRILVQIERQGEFTAAAMLVQNRIEE